jgi:alcohol dehydrogenase (cytochrome c)
MGFKDQQPASYSPKTGLFYVPTNNLCMDYEGVEVSYTAGLPYVGAIVKTYPGPGGHRGAVIAWDASTGKKVWEHKERFSAWGGTLVTSTDLVFYGSMDGWFKALDAKTGNELWKFKTGAGIIGAPMTYLGPDGKQYVAILAGVGGWAGATVSLDLGNADPTAALGAVNAFNDLGNYVAKSGMLYVFALD